MSYSQNNEEQVVLDYFGNERGAFLDIGAYDGRKFSNTYALAQRGWRGVCIEPSPAACAKLLELHGGNERIDIVNAAIAPEAGWALFHDSGGDGVSTLSVVHRAEWASQVAFRAMHLWAVTPAQLLEQFPGPFAFVSIDVEGLSRPILQKLPLAKMGTHLICVEHDGRKADVIEYCAAAGLGKVLLSNAENLVIGR